MSQKQRISVSPVTLILPSPSSPCSLNALPGRAQFDQDPFLADAGLFIQLNEPTCLCNRGLLVKGQPGRRGRRGRGRRERRGRRGRGERVEEGIKRG